MLTFELYAIGTNEDVTQGYHALFRRSSDGFYYNPADDEFSLAGDVIPYVEDPACYGRWTVDIPFATTQNGEFTLIPWDTLTGFLLADEVQKVWLVNDEPVPDYARAQVALYADYGGAENLRLTYENGDPLEGASIRVFDKASYDANDLSAPRGVSVTDADGQWLHPIFVNVGDTYVVHFQKDGFAGPVTQEVIVP